MVVKSGAIESKEKQHQLWVPHDKLGNIVASYQPWDEARAETARPKGLVLFMAGS